MFSSMGKRGDAARVEEIGFSAYLTKPIKHSQLFDCLCTVLGEAPTRSGKEEKRPLVTRHTLAEANKRKVRILLAEDNVVNQKFALHLIGKFGYRVDTVGNGFEAIQALEKLSYDLVLMDVQMPEMDGFEATRAIREKECETGKHIPIIAMTAHAMKGDREECIEVGMDDYVSKPIQPQQLREVIEKQIFNVIEHRKG